ncbi:helix-turn-helix transcriptional regulator [Demequina sp.]|uniref:helix-turn-helix transcriptional regulator n=1 Tax=Demequina sp. TaxID=2050685 RepID=UPI003A87E030
MTATTPVDTRRHAALASATRQRILSAMADAGGSASVSDLARAVRLHANTVRAHLELLEEVGLVRTSLDRSGRRGRPRQVFTLIRPTGGPKAGQTNDIYAELAKALLAGFGRQAADAVARAATSAERVGGRMGGDVAADDASADDTVTACLAAAGVEIAWRVDGAALVKTCPLADVARLHPEVVCPIHARMLAAALEEGAGIDRISVQPNVGGECIILGLGVPASP